MYTQIALQLSHGPDVQSNTEAAAFTGGLVGGLAGLAASLLGVGFPLVGSVGAVSPMLTALTGACVCALAGGLLGALTDAFGALDIDLRAWNWRDSVWTCWNASALPRLSDEIERGTDENTSAVSATPDEAERERRLYGTHADPLSGLPVTGDPEYDNLVAETIRR